GHDQDGAVHLRGAGDHVLDVVGVTRAIHVRVVPVRRRVLHVARRNRQNLGRIAAALGLGRFRDLVVGNELGPALVGGDLGQRRGERGLAVVDVPDGADVDVRFGTIKFFFRHACVSPLLCLPAVIYLRFQPSLPVYGADDRNRTGDLVL